MCRYEWALEGTRCTPLLCEVEGRKRTVNATLSMKQPFVALSKRLLEDGHHIRIATHECFRNFVTSHNIEFFPLAGVSMAIYCAMNGAECVLTVRFQGIRRS